MTPYQAKSCEKCISPTSKQRKTCTFLGAMPSKKHTFGLNEMNVSFINSHQWDWFTPHESIELKSQCSWGSWKMIEGISENTFITFFLQKMQERAVSCINHTGDTLFWD